MADQIGPDHSPKRTWGEKLRRFGKAFTTKYDSSPKAYRHSLYLVHLLTIKQRRTHWYIRLWFSLQAQPSLHEEGASGSPLLRAQ
jgi:hypothetical protein